MHARHRHLPGAYLCFLNPHSKFIPFLSSDLRCAVLGESKPSHISPLSRNTRVGGLLGPSSDEVILFGPRLSFVCGS